MNSCDGKLLCVIACTMFWGALTMCVKASDRVPSLYKIAGSQCVVPISAKYRSRGHRDYALARIFNSFSEFTLEQEAKEVPFPAAGWTPVLYDLFFVHVAGDCENRLKWVQMLVDDYH